VYCVVANRQPPRLTRVPAGLPGTGRVRLLALDNGGAGTRQADGRSSRPHLYLVVADAPLSRYGEAAIQRGLSDLDWVSRAAVAHESVIESFIDATAVLPMKLFTIFNTDERALAHIRADRARIDALAKRLANHSEWGVRILLDRARAVAAAAPARGGKGPRKAAASGLAYLSLKKAQRDASMELAERARAVVAALYDRLAARSRLARRRTVGELPAAAGPLLLDAAFLVPRSRSKTFRGAAAREARALARDGYVLTLTGPWPPYTFIE
jgi:hypothetical protein